MTGRLDTPRHRARAAGLLAATAAAAWWLSYDLPGRLARLRGLGTTGDFATSLVDLVAVAGWTAATWLLVSGVATVATAVLGPTGHTARVVRALTPQVWRRLVIGAAGAAMVAAPAAAVAATGGTGDDGSDHGRPVTERIDGLVLPDRPSGGVRHDSSPQPRAVRVRPGDSLWRIAQRNLPPGADAERVARVTQRWYAANRDRLGPDPDLIQPGTRLRPPADEESPR